MSIVSPATLTGERSIPRRNRWPVASGAAFVVLAAGAVAWLVLDDATLEPCETPRQPNWTNLEMVSANGDANDSWRFEARGGYRQSASDRWEVVVQAQMTNQTNGMSRPPHDSDSYQLVANGASVDPSCLVVHGKELVSPGADAEVLVGFKLPEQPTGAVSLEISDADQRFRVELAPATTE